MTRLLLQKDEEIDLSPEADIWETLTSVLDCIAKRMPYIQDLFIERNDFDFYD